HNNLAESVDYGCFLRYEIGGGVIDTLTSHDCITGYKQQYCTNITLQNSNLYGTRFSDIGIFLPVEAAAGFNAVNDYVVGYPTGILCSAQYDEAITGGPWNNHYNIRIPTSIDYVAGRSITITNPTFLPNTNPTHQDIYWENTFGTVFTRNLAAFFLPDRVLYNG